MTGKLRKVRDTEKPIIATLRPGDSHPVLAGTIADPGRIMNLATNATGIELEPEVPFSMATTPASNPRRQPRTVLAPPAAPLAGVTTIGALLKRLGNIPAGRVRLHPAPGTATEQDVIEILDRENRPCELVEGTLVEKPVGYTESEIAGLILTFLNVFVRSRKLGIVTGPDGTIRLFAGLVRIPDVAFASWDRFPDRKRPRTPIPHLVPDLVVEVLSKSNTRSEMKRKLGEYFAAGVRLVWMVDPSKRSVRVHTSASQSVLFSSGQSLDGGAVLPGFTLPLDDLFPSDQP
jgi:Uma2 family endonuclease